MDIKVNLYKTNPGFTAAKYKTLTDKMIPVLREAIKNGETVSSEKLAQKLGASKDTVRHILYQDKTSEVRNLFNQVKSPKGSKKELTDKTIAGYSAAMAAAATAGITLAQKDAETHVQNDYATYLAQKVEDMKLSDDQKSDMMGYLSKSPLFVDFVINNTDKNGNRRTLRSGDTKNLYRAYSINHELTEQLAKTFDEEGNFRYSSEQINKLLYINTTCPELYEEAQKNPDAIYEMYNAKDENENPRFGLPDIKSLAEKYKKFPMYTKLLLEEKDISGRPRFNAEQIIFILNELEGDNPEFVIDLVSFHKNIYTKKSDYVANRSQTVKLSGDNIIDIVNMDKKYDVQNFVYSLMDVAEKDNITGSGFVEYTGWATKSNVEFVMNLICAAYLADDINSLFESTGRKLTKEEFKEIETNIERIPTFLLRLKQFEQYVEK